MCNPESPGNRGVFKTTGGSLRARKSSLIVWYVCKQSATGTFAYKVALLSESGNICERKRVSLFSLYLGYGRLTYSSPYSMYDDRICISIPVGNLNAEVCTLSMFYQNPAGLIVNRSSPEEKPQKFSGVQ